LISLGIYSNTNIDRIGIIHIILEWLENPTEMPVVLQLPCLFEIVDIIRNLNTLEEIAGIQSTLPTMWHPIAELLGFMVMIPILRWWV
jgi:hypothetical protein